MRTQNQGFTLLEILVTVVIIAILAAIAVSAYQKAVVKSRFGSLMPLAKALTSSNEEFYLRNGRYASNVGDLDVTSSGTTRAQITMGNEEQHKYVLLTRNDMRNQLRMYQKHSPNFSGETHCEALIDDELANWLCRDSLKGTLVGNKYGYTVYSLSEETVGSLGRKYYDKSGSGNKLLAIQDGDECIGSGQNKCRYLNVTNATCTGSYRACYDSTFTNAKCVSAGNQSCADNNYNGSVCEGKGLWDCLGGSFDNKSTCIANPGSTESCIGSDSHGTIYFSNESVCIGRGQTDKVSCWRASFTNKSYCIGETKLACYSSTFNDTSYCEAKAKGACSNNTYNDQSYCKSDDGFCPVDSPKQGGGTWQLCEGEADGGKTC